MSSRGVSVHCLILRLPLLFRLYNGELLKIWESAFLFTEIFSMHYVDLKHMLSLMLLK